MKWIATNIRFPEDMYMALKLEAAKERKSVAAVVRNRVASKKGFAKKSTSEFFKRLDKIAAQNAKVMKGKSLSKLLIEMRYEQ